MTDATMLIELLSKITAPPMSPGEPLSVLTIMREGETWHLSIPGDKASFKLPECKKWIEASSVDLEEAAAMLLEAKAGEP